MEYDITTVLEYLSIRNNKDYSNYVRYYFDSASIPGLHILNILFKGEKFLVSFMFKENNMLVFIRNSKIKNIVEKIN